MSLRSSFFDFASPPPPLPPTSCCLNLETGVLQLSQTLDTVDKRSRTRLRVKVLFLRMLTVLDGTVKKLIIVFHAVEV